jgi:hypothetical protein
MLLLYISILYKHKIIKLPAAKTFIVTFQSCKSFLTKYTCTLASIINISTLMPHNIFFKWLLFAYCFSLTERSDFIRIYEYIIFIYIHILYIWMSEWIKNVLQSVTDLIKLLSEIIAMQIMKWMTSEVSAVTNSVFVIYSLGV